MIYKQGQNDHLKTPLEMLYHWESTKPGKVYLRQPINDQWHEHTWAEVADQVRRMATALKNKGYEPGSHIAIISKNCAHWMMADYAIWLAGHVSIPLYPNLVRDSVTKILTHSEAKLAFVGKLDDWSEIQSGIPSGLPLIDFPYEPRENAESWDDLVQQNSPESTSPSRDLDDIATIIYTSGTTGDPKGVVHKFQSFAFAGTNAVTDLGIDYQDRFFSYLPLAHVAERLLTETAPLYAGATVSFAESLAKFPTNLSDSEPTVFLSVPRLWSKFQQKILAKLPQKKLNVLLKIPVISKLIQKKIQKGLGCHKARIIGSGAAPISESLLHWFDKLGIRIEDCYAMTENFAYSFVTRPDAIRYGSCGQPMPGVDVKINDQGEVLVKSNADMVDYYRNPEETAKIFDEGKFIKTGDRGEIDSNGFLKITGRAKDIFKTSKGKYIAPSPIEKKLSACQLIEQICVVGSGLAQPLALIVLAEGVEKADSSAINEELEHIRKTTNAALDHHEHVDKIVVVKTSWSTENNFLTPTFKIKRNVIETIYANNIDQWSQLKPTVLWE
jgi:long-chain acyl-CoA synthetase